MSTSSEFETQGLKSEIFDLNLGPDAHRLMIHQTSLVLCAASSPVMGSAPHGSFWTAAAAFVTLKTS